MTAPTFAPVPEMEPDETEHRRKLARAVNSLRQGKFNGTLDVTLTANAASTTVTDARISYYSVILPMPMTSNAAAALATTYIAQATLKTGSAVLTHTNNAQTDKTFRLLIVG